MSKNVIGIIIIVMSTVLGSYFLLEGGFLTSDVDTFTVDESVAVTETEEVVEISLKDGRPTEEEVYVFTDGIRESWEDGKVVVEKSDVNELIIETQPDGEGIYDTYHYPIDENIANLDFSEETILSTQEVTISLDIAVNEDDTVWYVDDEAEDTGVSAIDKTFSESGEYVVDVEYTVDDDLDILYEISEELEVYEPDEIVLSHDLDETSFEEKELIELNVTEETDQGVTTVDIDWGDGSETNNHPIDEPVEFWYDDAGEYEITVSGFSEEISASGEVTEVIQITEAEEDDLNTLEFNITDNSGNVISEGRVLIGDQSEELDEDGNVSFDLQSGEYEVSTDVDGYVDVVEVYEVIDDDFVVDISLDEVEQDSNGDMSDNDDTIVDIGGEEEVLEFDPSEPDEETFEQTLDDEVVQQAYENINGEGTLENPYLISNYVELHAIRAEPNAVYMIDSNIDASNTLNQDTVSSVNDKVGSGSDIIFDLPYTQEGFDIDRVSVSIDGNTIESKDYQFTSRETVSYHKDTVLQLYFVEDGEQVSPSEKYDIVDSDSDIQVSYELEETVARGFRPIDLSGGNVTVLGGGHNIENLHMNRPLDDDIGLFRNGSVTVQNIGISSSITGHDNVGTILAEGQDVELSGIYTVSMVEGQDSVGSLIGSNTNQHNISDVYISTSVIGNNNVGGLAGTLVNEETVIGGSNIRSVGIITEESSVRGSSNVGGIVGNIINGDISQAYSQAHIFTFEEGIESSGGIAGHSLNTSIDEAYAIMERDDNNSVRGIVGENNGTVHEDNVYYSDTFESSAGEELQLESMRGDSAVNNMSNFDFDNIWEVDDDSYPQLRDEDLGSAEYTVSTDSEILEISIDSFDYHVDDISGTTHYDMIEEIPIGSYEMTIETADRSITEEIRIIGENTRIII